MLYYKPPADHIFEEVKEKCIEIWNSVGSHSRYKSEKINRIKNLKNVRNNVMFMVAMFDLNNQSKLARSLSKEARRAIYKRLESGGATENELLFWHYE